MRVGVILLAGGKGTRMQTQTPKQFLPLNEKPLALHSFDLFTSLDTVKQIVVVCPVEYQHLFQGTIVSYAEPGERRQDSCFNGLQQLNEEIELVCIHDSARPLITEDIIHKTFGAAAEHGACAVGVPLKFTIKELNNTHFVANTPDRSKYWEIQTPQVIKKDLLEKGFLYANENNLTVTDDVSLIELLGLPVKLVEGLESNIKVTTPHDFQIAHLLTGSQHAKV